MGSEANRVRDTWQDYSGKNAAEAKKDFLMTFETYFTGTDFKIISKAKDFQNIYVDIELRVCKEIS